MPSMSRKEGTFVCPWWLIRTFDNPLRFVLQKPERILRELVHPGDRCLDVGCGYGYFTIPMARLVGPTGSVVAVDLQPEMLKGVRRRAERENLSSRIVVHQADASGLHLDGAFDCALAFWMMHEVQDQKSMLVEICVALKLGARFLLSEPRLHVNQRSFDRTVGLAEGVGFDRLSQPRIFFSRSLLMSKEEAPAA